MRIIIPILPLALVVNVERRTPRPLPKRFGMWTLLLLTGLLGPLAGVGARRLCVYMDHYHTRREIQARLDGDATARAGRDPSPFRELEAYHARVKLKYRR
jgi:hypothetical protein